MAREYYSLVAGLREYGLDSDNKGFDAREITNEIYHELSSRDRDYMRLFNNFYDIENIINILSGRRRFNIMGNYSHDELVEKVKEPEELPEYIRNVLAAYNDPENTDFDNIDKSKSVEKALLEAYYNKCATSGCRFIRQWAEFDRNLRNVTAALTARRLGIPVIDETVGGDYVAEMLGKSSAADFGLKGEVGYIDQVINAVSEETNLLEKERKIDLLRWEMSDELTVFDYFNINTILAYIVKINIVQRWLSLDPVYGREMFSRLIGSMSGDEKINSAQLTK